MGHAALDQRILVRTKPVRRDSPIAVQSTAPLPSVTVHPSLDAVDKAPLRTVWSRADADAETPIALADPPVDPMLAFASEADADADAQSLVATPPAHPPVPTLLPPPAPVARRRFTWTMAATVVFGILALAQAALIGTWMNSGRVAAPADTGEIVVTSDPTGAPVGIDGARRGATPLTIALGPGSHRVEVGEGVSLRSQTVSVTRGGHASVHLELPAAVATAAIAATDVGGLQISSDPAGARVSIDGEARGIAPVTVGNLRPGDHVVIVTSNGATINRRVTVQAGVTSALIIAMNASSQFASGWLALSSPVPVQILVDGAVIGDTDAPRLLVSAGRHEMEFVNASLGFRARRTVQIGAGQTTPLTLEVPRGTININATPWAEIWIDGQSVGETPIGNYSLPIGTHELLFRHPDLGEQRRSVVVGAATPVRIGVDLRR